MREAVQSIATALEAVRGNQQLDEVSRQLWLAHGAGELSDDEATVLFDELNAKRVKRPELLSQSRLQPSRPRPQRSPDRQRSLERRRRLAASGPMPPALACHFTIGELAVLKIVADEVRKYGRCAISYAEMAARAGVCRATAKNALRAAGPKGRQLVKITIRERRGFNNLTNVVEVTSRAWLAWLARGPSGRDIGGKTFTPTGKRRSKSFQDRTTREVRTKNHRFIGSGAAPPATDAPGYDGARYG